MLLLMALVWLASGAAAQAQELAREPVHSDLPLYNGGEDVWPQGFYEGDAFGCASRVAFGDWLLREAGDEDARDAVWYGVANYGVFHCFALVATARSRVELEGVEARPSFFVLLGEAQAGAGPVVELWALQIGARPGSDYLLLSRPPQEGPVERFDVLQTECPRAHLRDAGALDILLTRYCAINTRADLLRFARRMARRPPRGTLERIETRAADAGRAQ